MTRNQAIHYLYSSGMSDEQVNAVVEALEQEPCEDAISRKAIKHKLQEHHDFFVNAYGGFSNLPQNDKARIDEITNCIAMVVNEPSVKPQEKTGHREYNDIYDHYLCGNCKTIVMDYDNFCPNCGTKMD